MIKKSILKTLLILSLSTTFLFGLPGNGVCIDKSIVATKINLSEYSGISNRTFTAYKYTFGVRKEGTLKYSIAPLATGFNLRWDEEYPAPSGDGSALYLAYDYLVTGLATFETKGYRWNTVINEGVPERGTFLLEYDYVDPSGYPDPLMNFPYSVVDVGYMWGHAFIEKYSSVSYPRVVQYAVLGLESVTVPAGTFPDCVKIARFRGNQSDRITWYAKGIGVVKMIYAQEEHSHPPFSFENPYPPPDVLTVNLQQQGYNRAFVLQTLD